jgi:hypothetical protein
METWIIDHSDSYAADDPGAEIKILKHPIDRKQSTGGVQVTIFNPITNSAPVRFVVAGDPGPGPSAYVITPGRVATIGGDLGLDWPADNVVGRVFSASGPENVDVTVALRPGN